MVAAASGPKPRGEKQMPLREETLRKNTEPPTFTPDREERTSFASFKEDRSAVAQSFLDSPVSSYAQYPDEAIEDGDSDQDSIPSPPLPISTSAPPPEASTGPHSPPPDMSTVISAPLTNPASSLHVFVCPADGFRGWKEIPVRGKMASRSFSDLRVFNKKGFTWEPTPKVKEVARPRRPSTYPPGEAPIERLPTELLGTFFHPWHTMVY